MAGYLGTRAVLLSTTAAVVTGDMTVAGDATVSGAFTSLGIDDNATSTAITIDANENVGINTASPSEALHVIGTIQASANFQLTANDSYCGFSANGMYVHNANDIMSFKTGAVERLRIDSSGNVIIGGTTYQGSATSGASSGYLTPNGFIAACVDSDFGMLINRTGTDGTAFQFRKDGSNVGSIGSQATGTLYIDTASGFGVLKSSGTNIFVWSTAAFYPEADNARDLGTASKRFDDVYATNGTIQTSDRNEKQDIAVMDAAETRVAVACKGLIRKFRWKDAVAEKGDNARIHFGIIAQDLQDAFTAEGLDAGHYAMFISSTWWEIEVVVPAVEAVAEVLDEDENVVTEAVDAVDAYTRTDTFDEVTEGATERTRLGVRYPELLAFIIGAL